MTPLRFTALLTASIAGVLAAAGIAAASARAEENVAPFWVGQTDESDVITSWQAVGPLIFRKSTADGGAVAGVRPLAAWWMAPDGTVRETNVLYPLFTYRTDGEAYRWSVFQLINRSGDRAERRRELAPAQRYDAFDAWPFWFSRRTGEPESSYSALFPIGGRIKNRLGYDQISFVLFPLYAQVKKRGTFTTSAPWPFVRVTRGAETGFALWPVFGWREKSGVFEQHFYLWPLGWSNELRLPADSPAGAGIRRETGFLPFFTRETSPGFVNASYLWPFFGYTDRTGPVAYHETRYFWPFLVQGHGDQKHVSRFGPFYTHSVKQGVEKTWVLWPFYREKRWDEPRIHQTQRQLLYFLYRSTTQQSRGNPQAAPAGKTTVWPLFSHWDNGAGREQFQFPSVLDVFFPDNERVRASWAPLFALYRFDQAAPGTARQEWLWGLISSRRAPGEREFHLGPLLSIHRHGEGSRVALGNGLVAWQREPADGRWRVLWLDFPTKTNKLKGTVR